MSIRVDPSSLIAGAVVVGDPGHGVLAELVPATGDAGAGYAYSSLDLPADNGKEIRGLITTWPANGTLTAYEDTSFEYDGTSDTFEWQLYVDGVAVGSPQTVTLTVGASAEIALSGAAVSLSTASAALTTGISLAGSAASVSTASGNLSTSITLSGAALAQATASAALVAGVGIFASDTFGGSAGQLLQDYDARWVRHPSYSLNMIVSTTGAVQNESTGTTATAYFYNAIPASADYSVSADLKRNNDVSNGAWIGVCGRLDPVANTMYHARYGVTSGQWQLYKFLNGSASLLASFTQGFGGSGTTRNVRLDMSGARIRVYIDGDATPIFDVTDTSPITGAGFAGIRGFGQDSQVSLQLDNFSAQSIAASAPIELAGTASGAASASGSLSTVISMAGNAAALAAAIGVLTAEIRLTGAASSSSTATGALTVNQSGLAGSAYVVSISAGDLTTGIWLSGDAMCASSAYAAFAVDLGGLPGQQFHVRASAPTLHVRASAQAMYARTTT